jgi:hypothetical protein
MTIGSNPDLWAIEGITMEPGDRVEFAGARLYSLLLQHEAVILQHWPPPEFIERLRADGVEEVLIWAGGYESIGQTAPWSSYAEEMHRLAIMNRLLVDQPNSFGEYWVDAYEASDPEPPNKPHSFAVDILKKGYAGEYIQKLGNIMFSVYGNSKPGLFFDNVLDREYYGTASNAPNRNDPDRIAAWRLGWKNMLGYCRKVGLGPIWGNCGATVHEYPELDVKFDERIFTGHLSPEEISQLATVSMTTGSQDRHGKDQGFCFHVDKYEGANLWAMDPEKWLILHEALTEKPVYVNTARGGFHLFHPGRMVCT